MFAQKFDSGRVVAQVDSERAIGPEFHHRAAHASFLGQIERDRIAEIDEARGGKQFHHTLGGVLRWEGDAIDAVRFTGALAPPFNTGRLHQIRTGAVQKKIALGKGGIDFRLCLHESHARETPTQHLLDTIPDIAGPEAQFRLR